MTNSPSPLSCFDLGERMLSLDEARAALTTLVETPVETECVLLAHAHGRRLAQAIHAPINVPQHTNAAMDGVALAWTSAEQTRWALSGRVFAGERLDHPVPAGRCVTITTGAPLPAGTDTVIMREQLDEHDDHVIVHAPERVKRGQNVRQAGEDIRQGATALPEGIRLDAAHLGLIASLGFAEVRVYRRPRVALFSTGNEVTAPGEPLPVAGIFDTNRFTLTGLLKEHGADVVDLGILPDDAGAIREALAHAAQASDLVLTSGGVSVGQADFTRDALHALGQLAFWRVAIRPGRPLACGQLGKRRTPLVGLPGNPVAVMVTFLQFVVPLLQRLEHQPVSPPRRLTAIADEPLYSRLNRCDFIRGVYHSDDSGKLYVRSTGAQGSGILTSMVAANCLIEVPDERESVEPGEAVTLQPLLG
ncbi:molybdopterin molybdenumtransferase MoeA [Halomonas alkaliantarctica]|nr:molybdopterin molybdenumtransferase MoeA [Halomonas alkaliantarctica]